ncbi:hypothetical protein ACTFIY_000310 [Dictyostelium cf. discoideum]
MNNNNYYYYQYNNTTNTISTTTSNMNKRSRDHNLLQDEEELERKKSQCGKMNQTQSGSTTSTTPFGIETDLTSSVGELFSASTTSVSLHGDSVENSTTATGQLSSKTTVGGLQTTLLSPFKETTTTATSCR